MQILPIDYKYTNSINSNKSFHGNITKKSLKSKTLKETAEKTSVQAATAIITLSGIDKLLRNRGITHCSSYGNQIDIASGYNGGFYTITVPVIMPTSEAKEYLECNFNKGQGAFGGVQNYMAMVKDIKRQDIVRKGLRVHTYDINNNISERQKDIANTYLSRILDKNIELNDMFFIDNEAFYYDKAEKTAYSILLYDELSGAIKPKLKTCKFTVGDNGDTIGYSVTEWNNYKMDYMQSSYIEQQKPSTKLKAIAEPDNNKEFAEAFRFGNSTPAYKAKMAIPSVLEHLSKMIGKHNLTSENLQIVKFFDKEKNINTRICYYDSSIGNSFVYNSDGKYLYRLEYNKDSEGNITSATRL